MDDVAACEVALRMPTSSVGQHMAFATEAEHSFLWISNEGSTSFCWLFALGKSEFVTKFSICGMLAV